MKADIPFAKKHLCETEKYPLSAKGRINGKGAYNNNCWYWLPASGEGMVLIRRQMLTHFPTVTKSAGFQPEPLLITHCSKLMAHYSLLIVVLASSQRWGRRSLPRRQMLSHFPTVTRSAGFQPEPLLIAHCSLLTTHHSLLTAHCSQSIAKA